MTVAAYTPPTPMPPYINIDIVDGKVRIILRGDTNGAYYGDTTQMTLPIDEAIKLFETALGNLR